VAKSKKKAVTGAKNPSKKDTPPRLTPPVENEADRNLVISFGRFDLHGPWCVREIGADGLVKLFESVRDYERMRAVDIFNGYSDRGADYTIPGGLCRKAQERLGELRLDDRDMISRLRITGRRRLFGLREGHMFYALWWDPEHEVYPVEKRHT